MTWVCSGCTFENISSKSELYCQVCQSQRPFGFVSCLTCTYFNSAANSNCEMCGVDLGNKSGTIADLLTVELPMKRKLAEDREDSRKQARNDVEIISSTSHPSSNIAINNYVNDARNSVNDGDVEIISSSSRKEVSPKPPVQPYQARDINLKWDGCVGMTACPTSSSTLTLPSILQTKDLVYAAFSSYCIDNDWLMSLIPSHIPWTIFNQRPKDLDPNTEIMNIAPGKRLVFPKMKGAFGCMHIKFLILFYPTRCRFILPSANIVDYDWSRIENVVYYQDFPVAEKSSPSKFQSELISTLRHMLSPPDIIERIRKYDFSKALGSLILSKPGSFSQAESQKFGQEALKTAVKALNILKTNKSYSYCQSSSMGALSQKWLDEFMSCVNGFNYNLKLDDAELKIVFPSDKTVKNSVLGPDNGGTIFAQRKMWSKPDFPRQYVVNCNSTSSRALMHSKIIIHSNCEPKEEFLEFVSLEDSQKQGYLYLGSHNHTQAAWGKWQIRNPILTVLNWELGIVIPIKYSKNKGFKIPFKLPPAEYSKSDFPWFNQIDFGAINRLKANFNK